MAGFVLPRNRTSKLSLSSAAFAGRLAPSSSAQVAKISRCPTTASHVSPAGVEHFAEKMNARLIVTGHQPQDTGYALNGDQHLIIASDHSQGVFLPLSLSDRYDMEELVGRLKKFVSIDLDALQEVTEDDGG